MRTLTTTLSVGLVSLLAGAALAAPNDAKGYAFPSPARPGDTITTFVVPDPAIDPKGLYTVVEDLSTLGGSAMQWMYDDGTNGDVHKGDGVFSFMLKLDASILPGEHWVPFRVMDDEGGSFESKFVFYVGAPPCSADFNGDGDYGTDADIEAFFPCLAGDCCMICGSADFNGDGDVATDADIEAFFRVLGGGPC